MASSDDGAAAASGYTTTRDLMIAGTLVSLVALALYGVLDGYTALPPTSGRPFCVPHHSYRKNFLHAKFLTIDDSIGLVGTSTTDIRSFVLKRAAARPHIRGFAAQCNHIRAAEDAAMPSQRVV